MIRNGQKRTISDNGGLGLRLLQMISEPNIERCAIKNAGSTKGWIVRSHIGWREERNILYKSVETSL